MAKKDLILEKTNNMKELHENSTTERMLTPMNELHENSTTEKILTLEENKNKIMEFNKPKKEREPSKSYTLKSFAENIKKIDKFGWLEDDERAQLQYILKNCISKYTQDEYGNN